ncbi:hypothetical protein [Sulfurimonas sp.]|jgi:hypothetical protein|uniref:hypothetical protein n=1 Tax=Sulfurimonas sp. TaxID=2022749 RepID=UPI0025DF268B|nr:hypothetical protein [Sulfurimonas sp.]MBT5934691.1 hypothetical protein [Sulfurimonas sp.]
MKKQAVKDIQEIIDYLLRIRERDLMENEENAHLINSFPDNDYDLEKENNETHERFDERLITLNKLLKKEQQNKKVLDIEEHMKKIQVKKYLSTSELAELYPDMSVSTQRDLRARYNNKLPYYQKAKNGKIRYVVEEVEIWLANEDKRKK